MKKPTTTNELDKQYEDLEQDAFYVLTGVELQKALMAMDDLGKLRPELLAKEEKAILEASISIVQAAVGSARKHKI